MLDLEKFLKDSRVVTERYMKIEGGPWSVQAQWDKIEEENDEFKFPTSSINELEEFWDCFFARLTLLHLKGVDDYAILNAAISTLKKIDGRSEKKLSEHEKKHI